MQSSRMLRADLVTGVVLFVLAVVVIYNSWIMDRLEVRQIHPSSAPGLTPGLLGIALAVTSVLLIVSSVRSARSPPDGAAPAEADGGEGENRGAVLRLLGTAVLCLVYALGLVGRMPFWLATALFVTSFIAIFEWERGGPPRRRILRLAWALFLGLATGLLISYAFRDLFLVRLP